VRSTELGVRGSQPQPTRRARTAHWNDSVPKRLQSRPKTLMHEMVEASREQGLQETRSWQTSAPKHYFDAILPV